MSNDRYDKRGESRRGAGRRVYPQNGAPRVGRVAADVPKAEKVDGSAPSHSPERYVPRDHRRQPDRWGQGGFRGDPRREYDPDRRDPIRGSGGTAPDGRADPSARPHHGAAWRSESGPQRRHSAVSGDSEPALPEDSERLLAGRNPIREALRAGRPVEKLLIASGDLSGAAREIIKLAKDAGVVVQQVDRSRLDQITPNHQGMLAYVAAVPYVELSDILEAAQAKGEDPFVILLDGVTDPHNLGAIIRSAECAGAHGVVIPERRASGLTPVVAKAAAGALSHMPVARVPNLNRAVDALKEAGVWIVGTAMDGENALSADLTGPIALVIGSEGDGISRLTLEKCDRTVSLPMKGRIESLNASVAAGILMYEVLRARAK